MRLWSIHPKYLDSKGLVALWREALLAQKVLEEKTQGYRNHPQLTRFKLYKKPLEAIGSFLNYIYKEGTRRGYNFNKNKILFEGCLRGIIEVSDEQINYEFKHLIKKLEKRDLILNKQLIKLRNIEPNPLFKIIKGKIELWEKTKDS